VKSIFFRTPKTGSTSILAALENVGIYDSSFQAHEIQTNGFCVVRPNLNGNEFEILPGPHPTHTRFPKEWEGDFEQDAYLWTVVRNPWDTMVSAWLAARKQGSFAKRHSFRMFVEGHAFLTDYSYRSDFNKVTSEEHTLMMRISSTWCDCDPELIQRAKLGQLRVSKNSQIPPGVLQCKRQCIPRTLTTLSPSWIGGTWLMANGSNDFWVPRDFSRILRFENLQNDFNLVCDDFNIDRIKLPTLNSRTEQKRPYQDFYDDNEDLISIVAKWFASEIKLFKYNF
jgi:hypothetical protein